MTYRNRHSIVSLICAMSLCVASINVFAQESGETSVLPGEHTIVCRMDVPALSEAGGSLEASQEVIEMAFNQRYDDRCLYFIHSNAYYYPSLLGYTENKIQLCDTSVWAVNPRQIDLVERWMTSDPIFIKPNAGCFSSYSYPYVFQNLATQEVVQVKLLDPSFDMGIYTRWIISINRESNELTLNDQSVWSINPKNSSFSKWKTGHIVMIGVNNKWRTAP